MITYRLPLILTLIIVAVFNAQSQDRFYSPGFQPAVILNPAVAGIEGDGILRMVYMTQYPGQGFNLHSFSGSYDAFISVLHGGIAGYISNDYLGIINDIRGGFSYSYHLRASKDLYINAGLSASFQHRGINTVKMVLPDQIDPLQGVVLPSAEEISGRGRTIFDVGTGFVMISGNYLAGISVNHLARPDLEGSGSQESSLARRMTFFASGTFRIGKTIKTVIKPVIYFDVAGKEILAATGIVTATETVAVNTILM
ncbi:MAG: PorP/SprF family type IX secretion system membrane protein, partial [Bacteroidales bacterium]